jgi:hypothetical protein
MHHGCDRLGDAFERSHLCSKAPGTTNLFLAERRAHLNGFDQSVHEGARAQGAGIRDVRLPLRLRFVRPHRFELLRKSLCRRILCLPCNAACVSIVADTLTVSAFAGLAWRHCRIART